MGRFGEVECDRAVLAVVTAVALLSTSCAAVRDVAQIRKPTVRLGDVRVDDLTFRTIDLAFDVAINNPNPLSVSLAGFDYDFKLDERNVVSGEQDQTVAIDAFGTSTVAIPVRLDFVDLYENFQALGGKDTATYELAAGASFELPVIGTTRIPVNTSGELPLLKIPTVRVRDLRVEQLGLSGADLALELEVWNPNAFGLGLERLDYAFEVDGRRWAAGDVSQSTQVAAKRSGAVVLPLNLDFAQTGGAIYQLLASGSTVDYRFTGSLDLTTTHELLTRAVLPFDTRGDLAPSR